MSRFSAPVFLLQLLVVPLLGLIVGSLAVECFDAASGSRGNQLVGWSCYALVGLGQGYLTGRNSPEVDCSWARFVWIIPVAVFTVSFFDEYRRDPHSAISEYLIIDPYSASRGFGSAFFTAPALATCFYSVGVWVALGVRRPEDGA